MEWGIQYLLFLSLFFFIYSLAFRRSGCLHFPALSVLSHLVNLLYSVRSANLSILKVILSRMYVCSSHHKACPIWMCAHHDPLIVGSLTRIPNSIDFTYEQF
ncbi:hypothetical protein BX666DRAFT_1923633 [Dichotomocladium elegans]|nr:hypothetical protein BX666DRAFT_1923633 [Dichotomocladium elegans]